MNELIEHSCNHAFSSPACTEVLRPPSSLNQSSRSNDPVTLPRYFIPHPPSLPFFHRRPRVSYARRTSATHFSHTTPSPIVSTLYILYSPRTYTILYSRGLPTSCRRHYVWNALSTVGPLTKVGLLLARVPRDLKVELYIYIYMYNVLYVI